MEHSPTFSAFLKTGTHDVHDKLDKRIMQLQPFASAENYRSFLRMQLRLHAAAESLYQDDVYQHMLPDLKLRSRLLAVLNDCQDLTLSTELQQQDKQSAATIVITDPYAGLGWIYTVEGSTLGAAMLLKHVKHALELSEAFGAQHMASHADGRATHWREFKAILDALELTDVQKEQALQGAIQAFQYANDSVEECMAEPATA